MQDWNDILKQWCQHWLAVPSVTPDGGAGQDFIAEILEDLGFTVQRHKHADVANLWAERDPTKPTFLFLGHSDVVPADPKEWQSDPFILTEREDTWFARGIADMKGAVLAMLMAYRRILTECPDFPLNLAMLLTGDEEGEAKHGTVEIVKLLAAKQRKMDYVLIGEPSSKTQVGDSMRIGRRGSLHVNLRIQGEAGHVAYPEKLKHPVQALTTLLNALELQVWDLGLNYMPATSMQIVSMRSESLAENMTPSFCDLHLNFRYSAASTAEQLLADLQLLIENCTLPISMRHRLSGRPFYHPPGRLAKAAQEAVFTHSGLQPELNAGGGTSDGRFITTISDEIVEFGLCNASIHKANECCGSKDIAELSSLYLAMLYRLAGMPS
jgi:succinyl-diaminopimelate desuccinylase